jgi:NAD(P)-dependent dehydrogenase (short-subunit alcohol dehydrogenase family)
MSWGEPSCAVITGAASGMGLATARHFLAEGWTVVAVDRAESALDAAADDLASDRLLAVVVDVTDRAALETALDRVGDDPRLRAVVNVAGIYPPTTLADFTEAVYRRTFDVNVLGTLNVCAVTAPRLAAAGGGAIVNFASVDALAVSPGQLVYSASKAAVMSITRSLAVELAPDGITVNGVAPGWVDTPGNAATGRMAEVVSSIPLGRVSQPDEIAHWVWQLVQGPYVTGETMVISGGSLIR